MRSIETMNFLRAQLQDHEGSGPIEDECFFPYDDATGDRIVRGTTVQGCITIGYGRNLTDDGLSEGEVSDDLDHDVADAVHQVAEALPWADLLDDVRWRVLVDMCFNLGLGSAVTGKGLLGFRMMLQHVQEGHYMTAAWHMRQSLWAKQVGRRAVRLAQMMETGQEASG